MLFLLIYNKIGKTDMQNLYKVSQYLIFLVGSFIIKEYNVLFTINVFVTLKQTIQIKVKILLLFFLIAFKQCYYVKVFVTYLLYTFYS